MFFVFDFFGQDGGVLLEFFDFFIDGELNSGIDLGLLGLSDSSLTISFFRTEMLLAYSSRKDFSFFHADSANIFRNTINRTLKTEIHFHQKYCFPSITQTSKLCLSLLQIKKWISFLFG